MSKLSYHGSTYRSLFVKHRFLKCLRLAFGGRGGMLTWLCYPPLPLLFSPHVSFPEIFTSPRWAVPPTITIYFLKFYIQPQWWIQKIYWVGGGSTIIVDIRPPMFLYILHNYYFYFILFYFFLGGGGGARSSPLGPSSRYLFLGKVIRTRI